MSRLQTVLRFGRLQRQGAWSPVTRRSVFRVCFSLFLSSFLFLFLVFSFFFFPQGDIHYDCLSRTVSI